MEVVAVSSDADAVAAGTKVLLVAPPAEGGLASHVIALLAGLDEDGYQLGVACDSGGPIAAAAADRGLAAFSIMCSTGGGPLPTALRAARMVQVIREFGPQIVHTHSFGATAIGSIACAIVRPPRLVVTIHNYPPGTADMVPRKRGQRWALGLALQRADRIITVSEALREDLVRAHPETLGKCQTIYNGVDTQATPSQSCAEVREALRISSDGPLVGMIARLAPQKGIEHFIRAAATVAKSRPASHFVLAGEGPLMESARGLRDELGLAGNLHLVGKIGWVRELIAALDVLVVASVSEGSSVVAMEAMALRKPVVATAVGGVPEVVLDGQTGTLVPPGDPESLAGAVSAMLDDPSRAREMGERGGQTAVSQFDVRDMLARTKAVYADLVREQTEARSE